jgi:anti-anti-sigma regulatory factor/anti-sigma regulatory factor (Ser/Thr protein kinase)
VPARIECVAESLFPVCVVRVSGALDVPGATTLRSCVLGCLTDQPVAVVVDMSGVSVADDVALALLPTLADRSAEWPGTELVLYTPDPVVAAALDRAGVTRGVRVYRDRQEALAVAARLPIPLRLRQHLLPVADAPRQARDLVEQASATWLLPADSTQVAQVIATELVTNVVRHAGTPMDFSVLLRDQCLHLAVRDNEPTLPRREIVMTERDDHGRGLQLVDGLAASWGCTPVPGGKVVWATVPTG